VKSPLLIIFTAPSGAGKTTLVRHILEQREDVAFSVSATTRKKREGETDGKDYFFVSEAEYNGMVERGDMLEYARVFDHHYGTPADFVQKHITNGTDVLFDIDWQGTRQLKEKNRQDLVSIFILPPSLAELERRLMARAQDSESVVKMRMLKAAAEMSHWQEYDYVLINQDLDETLEKINHILLAERLKRARQEGLPEFVRSL
jgi:guanylate kinase